MKKTESRPFAALAEREIPAVRGPVVYSTFENGRTRRNVCLALFGNRDSRILGNEYSRKVWNFWESTVFSFQGTTLG